MHTFIVTQEQHNALLTLEQKEPRLWVLSGTHGEKSQRELDVRFPSMTDAVDYLSKYFQGSLVERKETYDERRAVSTADCGI